MKIISTPDMSNWSYKYTCKDCESVLEIEAQDLKYHCGQQGDSDWYTTKCIVCGQVITIADSKLPKLVALRIKGKVYDR